MSVKIRLTRMGSKKQPFYRIVVADIRSPRDGKFIEKIGIYDPKSDPSRIEVDRDKALDWIKKGAKPTNTVQKLFNKIELKK
ncbi:MAG: 30S ribosomal protein S16 [Actinobacteria bacterium RBG_19FT_COMBO_36_27]|nr:MAG: 30S ribosomal protein S16 [Actinobacteria bacterium RBG_19FT_COMBO_36_27]OGD37952.1 MAG: 30S ribosomal protein S16 [Candidatus Atribacteria bacterium RBG_16_35_8]